MLKIAMLLGVGLSVFSAQAGMKWGMNDVSILLPISEADSASLLPKANEAGEKGTLLPRAIFDRVGRLAVFEEADTTYSKLRVVAIRIDPCFRTGSDFKGCRPMVRFVWQPVFKLGAEMTTTDAALHTFYDLSRADFNRLAAEIDSARAPYQGKFVGAALGIHPVIAQQGLKGTFYTQLIAILTRYAGAANLTRMTFMKLSGGGSMWDFGGFEIVAGATSPITIPRVSKPRQVFVNGASTGETDFFSTQLVPEPTDERNVNWLIKDSNLIRNQDRRELVIANVKAARELENPNIAMTDATDCVSCHLAQPARLWALRSYPELDLENQHRESVYTSATQPLENTSQVPDFTTNLRGFGYFANEPAISRRVIHESAEVADAMNQSP